MRTLAVSLMIAVVSLAATGAIAQNRIFNFKKYQQEQQPAQGAYQQPYGQQPQQHPRIKQLEPVQDSRGQYPSQQYSQAPQAQPASSGFVIMEFSDLQCPDSARFNSGLKQQIMQRYVNSGQARFEWRDFPLPSHQNAPAAAAAARCAGPQADAVRQMMMQNQGALDPGTFAQYAQSVGVNPQQFQQCMMSGQSTAAVSSDRAMGQQMGVRGTPTLVVAKADANGQMRAISLIKAHQGSPQDVMAQIDRAMAGGQGQQQR